MHADLMGAAGVEVALHEGVALVPAPGLEALEHAKRRDGLPCEGVVRHRHLHAVARRAGDARVDRALVMCDVAVHERDVATIERAQANEILQRSLGSVVFRRKHETRRVAVEPMHDTRPVLSLKRA